MNPVSAPADKRFRRAHTRPARKRQWRSLVLLAAVYGLCLAGLAYALYRGNEVVAHARVLQIDQLVVHGNERVPSAALLAVVDGLKGQNLILTDLDEWRQRLLESPWVRDASLRRSLPSTVEICVSERTPAIIARMDSRLFLVDDQGIVIDQYGPRYASFDLPIVDGLRTPNAGPGVRVDQARAALAARVVASLRGRPELARRLSQIDVSDAHNAHVTLTGDTAVLFVGEDQFQQRIESYLQLADTLRASVPDIDYVDLRFGERVFVGPVGKVRKPAPAVRAMQAARRVGARQ